MSVAKLREALKNKNLIFGARQTLRNLKLGKVKIVIMAKDCQESTRKAVLYYSSLKKIDIVPMEQDSKEIAQLCKKNYPVSILSY